MDNAMAVVEMPDLTDLNLDAEHESLMAAVERRFLSDVEIVPITLLEEADSPRSGGLSIKHVRLLAETDAALPPLIVHRKTMRVIDGMHRMRAAILRDEDHVAVRFFDGDERDAFVLAVSENIAHGLPLSAADRSAAATRILLSHPEWSDRSVAAVAGISAKTVRALRAATTDVPSQPAARIGRDGRIRPVSSAEGRLKAAELIERNPGTSLRKVAREAGVSLGTVRDVRQRMSHGENVVPLSQQPAARMPPAATPARAVTAAAKPPTTAGRSSVSMRALLKDPSLRLTEDGRNLLRLLATHRIPHQDGGRLVACVPSHAIAAVYEVALECAAAWQEFAERLSERDRAQLGQTP